MPTGVVAQVIGPSDGDPIATFDKIAKRIEELERVDQENGAQDAEIVQRRRELIEMAQRGRLSAEVDQLSRSRPSEN